MLLNKILGAVVLALSIAVAIQWVAIAGYKASTAKSGMAISSLTTQLSVQKASNAALQDAINRQNTTIEMAAQEAARKRAAALAARDRAVADLATIRGDYANLRKTWPKECVAAVSAVRRELGL